MSRPSYFRKSNAEFDVWFRNFIGKLPLYSTALAVSAAEVSSLQNYSTMVTYTLTQIEWFENELAKRRSYRNQLLDGEIGATAIAFPALATPPAAPTAVPTGLVKILTNMIKRIKSMPAYTEMMGKDLGIIDTAILKTMKATPIKPSFTISISADRPVLKWYKGNTEAIDILVDRNDGKGFVLAGSTNRATFTDMHELPTTLVSWTYKIVYKRAGVIYGEYSDPCSIAVINRGLGAGQKD